MTTIAAPSANQVQSTLTAAFTRGTSTTLVLTDGSLFPSPTPLGHVVYVHNADESKWCLVIYTSRVTNTLTMGGGAADYALAKNVSIGDEAHEFAIGSVVELVCAADEIAQIMDPIEAANAGEIFFKAAGGLKASTGLHWDDTDKQQTITKAAIAATQGDYGLKLINTTAALTGERVQLSPPSIWQGYGWETDVGSSMAVAFRAFARPITGAAAPTGALDFQSSIDGGVYSDLATFLSSGFVGFGTIEPDSMLHIYSLGIQTTMHIDGRNHAYVNVDRGDAAKEAAVKLSTAGDLKWAVGLADSDIAGLDGTEFFIGQLGSGSGAKMVVKTTGVTGFGTPSPIGQVHIDQASSSGNRPVISLDQGDASEGFIDFISASAASAVNPISTWTAGNTIQGFVRVGVNEGVAPTMWVPFYDAPTS